MEIKFNVKMTQKIMYNFLMNHTYRSVAGVVGVLFGLSALVLAGVTYGDVSGTMTILYVVFGIWFLAYTPYTIFIKSVKQVQGNAVFEKPIEYILNEENIIIKQRDQQAEINWNDIVKVRETKLSFLLYTGARYSFVWPKESIGEQKNAIVEMIKSHVDSKKISIKA